MKSHKNCLYRFSALWSGVCGAYRNQSLYGVVIIFRTVWLLVYIIGAYAMFLPRTATLPYRSISPRRVRLCAYAGVCINPAVGFPDRFMATADYLFPYARRGCVPRVAVHAYFTSKTLFVWAVGFCAIGTGVNYLGIQQRPAKFISYWSLFNLGILAIFVPLLSVC